MSPQIPHMLSLGVVTSLRFLRQCLRVCDKIKVLSHWQVIFGTDIHLPISKKTGYSDADEH